MSRKRAITTFLSRKFIITRLSIALEDFLGSSIASQVMPPCLGLKRIFYFLKENFEALIPWLKVLFCVECFHFTDCKNIWRRILEIFHLSPLLISFVAPDILFVETWRMEMRKIDLKVFFRCVNLYVKRILFDLKTKIDLKLRNQPPFTLSMFNFIEWKCFIWTIKLLHLTWFIGNGKHGWPFFSALS